MSNTIPAAPVAIKRPYKHGRPQISSELTDNHAHGLLAFMAARASRGNKPEAINPIVYRPGPRDALKLFDTPAIVHIEPEKKPS